MQDILTLGDVPSEASFTEDKKLILHTYLMISGNRVMFRMLIQLILNNWKRKLNCFI